MLIDNNGKTLYRGNLHKHNPLAQDDHFICTEVIDETCRKAWTTPVPLNEEGG
ncbi:MAG: hypothetical protein GX173_05830 [Ruminococcaceae bacterium]|jgi:hypothetical protein|nr:hypothetical protein [Oscillospiraceae bacterium]